MNKFSIRKQQGSTLLIGLITLLVITVLAVGSMRGVSLESKISANRSIASAQQGLADAALREGEFRFYGPAFLRQKLEADPQNCKMSNKLNVSGNNKPCLINEITADAELEEFFAHPLSYVAGLSAPYNITTGAGAAGLADGDNTKIIAWMPYRGLDAENSFEGGNAYWNSYRMLEGADSNETVNPEYGAVLEGKGTYYFLINGQTGDQIATQSTLAVIYLGLNF